MEVFVENEVLPIWHRSIKKDGGLDTVFVWKNHKRESKELARLNETMTACFRWTNTADLNQNKKTAAGGRLYRSGSAVNSAVVCCVFPCGSEKGCCPSWVLYKCGNFSGTIAYFDPQMLKAQLFAQHYRIGYTEFQSDSCNMVRYDYSWTQTDTAKNISVGLRMRAEPR